MGSFEWQEWWVSLVETEILKPHGDSFNDTINCTKDTTSKDTTTPLAATDSV